MIVEEISILLEDQNATRIFIVKIPMQMFLSVRTLVQFLRLVSASQTWLLHASIYVYQSCQGMFWAASSQSGSRLNNQYINYFVSKQINYCDLQ